MKSGIAIASVIALASALLLSAQTRLEHVSRRIVTHLAGYDVVITPALGMRPVKIGEIHGRGPEPWAQPAHSGASPIWGDRHPWA